MQTSLFNYDLPDNLIAQQPLLERDASRLLVADPATQSLSDAFFAQLPGILKNEFCVHGKRPLIVLNRSRVFPARVRIKRESGGRGEVFLLNINPPTNAAPCLIRPQKKLREGETLFADTPSSAQLKPLFSVTSLTPPAVTPIGETLQGIVEKFGEMPLPPYIQRDPQKVGNAFSDLDKQRYQTLYSQEEGSVAAATAGLHFTQKVMEECATVGCEFAHVILHVGLGTFMPVQAEQISNHKMHEENYLVPKETCEKIVRAVATNQPIIFVGTTSLRTVESFIRHALAETKTPIHNLRATAQNLAKSGELLNLALQQSDRWLATNLFLYPSDLQRPKTPTLGDAILTNFHQPQSTLVMLVASILGYEFWKRTYEHAMLNKYRFLSYGDSSLLFFSERLRS